MEFLGRVLEGVLSEVFVVVLGDLNAHEGIDGETWRGVIWWKGLSDLNLSGVFIWISDAKRSRIDFVVISSNLLLYGLDLREKKGAQLSPPHHVLVS